MSPSTTSSQNVPCAACGGVNRMPTPPTTGSAGHACPSCGWRALAPIRRRRSTLHLAVATLSAVVLVLLLLAVFLGMKISTWTLLAVLASVMLTGAHLAISFWDPNRDLARNREQAQQQVKEGVVEVVSRSRASGASAPPAGHGLTWLRLGILAVSCLAVCALGSAELLRRMKGWVDNEGVGVVGPGDSFTVYFPTDKESIGGQWKGLVEPMLVMTAERSGPMNGLTGVTRQVEWGSELQGVGGSRRIQPWATVTLPDRHELVGRKIPLQVRLVISYPSRSSTPGLTTKGTVGATFSNDSTNFAPTYNLTLADPGAGRKFRQMWYLFGVGGTLVFLFAGFALAAEGFLARNE